jgi:hypothetical protein
VTDVQRQIRLARVSRVLFTVPAVIFAALFAVHLASGAVFLGVLNAITAALFTVSIVLTTVRIRMMRGTLARTETSLPRMTPGDYRRLREMEIELGWEPSEVPAGAGASPESSRAACECGHCDGSHEGPGMRWFPDTRITESAPMTGPGGRWHLVSELPEVKAAIAAAHFAELANVGREHCTGFCPICEERDHR